MLFAAFAALIFCTNLGGQDLTLDEPETLAVAKTIGIHGFPSAWDGKQFITVSNGLDSTSINGTPVWSWHPWLQHYIAFAGMQISNSTGVLRFPFALFGVATVVLLYIVARMLYKNEWIAVLLSLQLIFLLPFFLYVRQIRYYSLSAFFSLLLFWLFYVYMASSFKKKHWYLLCVGSFLLFFSNYVVWASSILLFFMGALEKRDRKMLLQLVLYICFGVLWFLFLKPAGGNSLYFYKDPLHVFIFLRQYLSYINGYTFPIVLLPFVFYLVFRSKRYGLVVLWISIKLIVYAIFLSPTGRYAVDLMPVFVLLFGVLYLWMVQKKAWVFLGFFVVIVITTNIVHSLPFMVLAPKKVVVRIWPQAYAAELTQVYPSVMDDIAMYMQKHAKVGDVFWSNEYKIALYNKSTVGFVLPLCNGKTLGEPIRWILFFTYNKQFPQTLEYIPCLGKVWQEKLAKEYKQVKAPISLGSVAVNDPDIVGRKYPPYMVTQKDVILYERKE